MKRQTKINFYKGLDTDMLIQMSKCCCEIEADLLKKLAKIRDDQRAVNLVLKGRQQGVC